MVNDAGEIRAAFLFFFCSVFATWTVEASKEKPVTPIGVGNTTPRWSVYRDGQIFLVPCNLSMALSHRLSRGHLISRVLALNGPNRANAECIESLPGCGRTGLTWAPARDLFLSGQRTRTSNSIVQDNTCPGKTHCPTHARPRGMRSAQIMSSAGSSSCRVSCCATFYSQQPSKPGTP